MKDHGCNHVVLAEQCDCGRCVVCNAHPYEILRDYKTRLAAARKAAKVQRALAWAAWATFVILIPALTGLIVWLVASP